MAALSPASKSALARLRAFRPPPTSYFRCPVKRRAAVLILLYADRRGDLRVVLTIRSSGLKNYAGQAALPGGKADFPAETPAQTARREAWEEVGLPLHDAELPPGYSVEHLTELPSVLAVTELAVRPCVAYLKSPAPSEANRQPDVTRDILPKLNATEVAALFTAPFYNFLLDSDLDGTNAPGLWYTGTNNQWYNGFWRTHAFGVPVSPSTLFLARVPTSYAHSRQLRPSMRGETPATADSTVTVKAPTGATILPLPTPLPSNQEEALRRPRYRVFGMTARILVDCAKVAYAQEPNFLHTAPFGDEEMLARLLAFGRMKPEKDENDPLTLDILKEAAKAKL